VAVRALAATRLAHAHDLLTTGGEPPRLRDTLDLTAGVLHQALVIETRHQARDLALVGDMDEIGDLTVARPWVSRNRRENRVCANRETEVGS
jgi:hypothetical protein